MIRRSRCVYAAVLTALVYAIIFSVLSHERKPLFPAHWAEIQLDFSLDLDGIRAIFKVRDSYSFDTWADAVFRRKLEENPGDNALRMAKYAVYGPESSRDAVELPSFLRGEGENPHMAPHDPRVTLGALLSELNRQMAESIGPDSLRLDTFHWADWTDLSLLDRKALSVKDWDSACDTLNPKKHEQNTVQSDVSRDASQYCFNDADLSATLAKNAKTALGPYLQKIAEQPYRTGLHVHSCPARAAQRIRKMAAQSYLHDFMPAPMAVHILVPVRQSHVPVHVTVSGDVAGRVRLVDTPLAASLAQAGALDLRQQLAKLAEKVGADSVSPPAYQKSVSHDDFVDKSGDIVKELLQQKKQKEQERRQEKNKKHQNLLSSQDTLYLESLQLSLATQHPSKYLYEALLVRNERNWASGGHYDWRFFKGLRATSDAYVPLLHGLISAWLRFTNANNITTWLAHGSLLGWYWNGLSFPWDSDYDVQVPISQLHRLARRFNQTVVVDFGSENGEEVRLGRYFLDCGTWISHRDPGNGLNNIDARFIDMDSGLYIDITAVAVSATMAPLRYDAELPAELRRTADAKKQVVNPKAELRRNTVGQLYNCRNRHFQSLAELSPLRLTMMEGVPAYVPNNFTEMLQVEYGRRGLELQKFHMHAFLPRLRLWANIKVMNKYIRDKKMKEEKEQNGESETKVALGPDARTASQRVDTLSVFTFSDQDYLDLMATEGDLLVEYLVSKDATALHQQEMELLLQGKSTQPLLFSENEFGPQLRQLRHDINNFLAAKEQRNYTQKVAEYVDMYRAFQAGEEVLATETNGVDVSPMVFRQPVRVQSMKEASDPQRTRPEQKANIVGP